MTPSGKGDELLKSMLVVVAQGAEPSGKEWIFLLGKVS
jgi:hypothetical protein